MNLSPQAILLTNLELDHPDYYHDLADIKNAFHDYIHKLSDEDLLIVNNDDGNIRDVTKDFNGIMVRYGIGGGADLIARNITQSETEQTFELVWKGTPMEYFSTPMPGLYNIYNIVGACATYLAYGGRADAIQSVLAKFIGVGRRFEVVGNLGNTIIISDYAHHPTALKAVVDAALSRYKGKSVLTVFRPHHRERTIKLMDEFVNTVLGIPHCVLIEIYDVAGREEDTPVSSNDIIHRVFKHDPQKDVVYAKDLVDAEEMIRAKADLFDVILVVGAGDAGELAKRLVQ
jgi:UDP-N-acetylmuramate--alanine ligase